MRKSWARVQKLMKAKDQDLLCAIIKKHYPLIPEDLQKAIFCIDKNGEIVFVSRETARIFNITIEKFYEFKNIRNLWKAAWITTGKSDLVPFEKSLFRRAVDIQTSEGQGCQLLVTIPLP